MKVLQIAQNIIEDFLKSEFKDLNLTNTEIIYKKLINVVLRLKTDSLTNAYTRGFLEELLDSLINYKKNFNVVFIDLDDFKKINETFGHQIGDKGLKLVGSIINKYKVANSFFARYGGDEFILIIDDIERNKILESIKKIKHELKAKSDLLGFNLSITLALTNLNKIENKEALYEKLSFLIRKQKNTKKDEIISDIF